MKKKFLTLLTGTILILGLFASASQNVFADINQDSGSNDKILPIVPNQILLSFKPGVMLHFSTGSNDDRTSSIMTARGQHSNPSIGIPVPGRGRTVSRVVASPT